MEIETNSLRKNLGEFLLVYLYEILSGRLSYFPNIPRPILTMLAPHSMASS